MMCNDHLAMCRVWGSRQVRNKVWCGRRKNLFVEFRAKGISAILGTYFLPHRDYDFLSLSVNFGGNGKTEVSVK